MPSIISYSYIKEIDEEIKNIKDKVSKLEEKKEKNK